MHRHVKKIVCDHTTYIIYTQVTDDCTWLSNLSVTNGVTDLTPKKQQNYWCYGNGNKFGSETGKE